MAATINEETGRKLCEINMGEAITGLEVQQEDPLTIALPFDERVQRLVDYIYQEKYNGNIQRLIKPAKLRFLQAIIYVSCGLNRELIENLFSGQYIGLHQSIILQGFIGLGKTYLALCPGKRSLPAPCQGAVYQAVRFADGVGRPHRSFRESQERCLNGTAGSPS